MNVSRWLHDLIDLCYPGVCWCGQRACEGSRLCEACRFEMSVLVNRPACEKCSLPLATHRSPCPRCRGRGFRPFSRILSLGVFEDPLKHLIYRLKYHHEWSLGESLADELIAHEPVKDLLTETDVLVPVPLHPLRHVSRGYNQADVIARRIGSRCEIKTISPLIRTRNTQHQTDLTSKAKRLENVRGAFEMIDGKSVRGKHVTIIDDVMTIGATLRSAARALESANPASLSAIVVAVADPRGRGFERI